MSAPTTGEFLNQTIPAPTTGDQTVVVQSDGATPQQSITFVPKRATGSLFGTVKPDGTTIVIASGVITAVPPSGAANLVEATPDGSSGPAALRALVMADLPASAKISIAGITIDGGGSTPATGSKGFLQIPFAGTITGWTLIADVSGAASITVKKSTFAAFPTNTSIVASAPPSLSSAQNATSSTLTGWTTAVAAGDVLEFVLTSASALTRLTLELQIKRT